MGNLRDIYDIAEESRAPELTTQHVRAALEFAATRERRLASA
jgi:hypothetical protein